VLTLQDKFLMFAEECLLNKLFVDGLLFIVLQP
jgi:hypothetical protein